MVSSRRFVSRPPRAPAQAMLYPFLRPALFALDPERAHDLAFAALDAAAKTGVAQLAAPSLPRDPVRVMGLEFPNRVGLAAGLDKNALCIDGLGAMGFGFVEVGTVTPKGQPGNPKPRMFRLPQADALINRLGFNNDGLDAFLSNVKQARCRQPGTHSPMKLGLNIGKNATTDIAHAADDYLTCLDGVYPHADYVTINISSPNTQNLRSLQTDAALDALLDVLSQRRDVLASRHGKHIPLFVKIAPDLDEAQVASVAMTLKRYGCGANGQPNQAWGVIATNTTLDRTAVAGMPHAQETGGLSGRPVFEKSNQVIRQLRAALGKGFPIVGVGGILSGADAVTKIQCGADLVQIYTGLIYKGPGLVSESASSIKNALRA